MALPQFIYIYYICVYLVWCRCVMSTCIYRLEISRKSVWVLIYFGIHVCMLACLRKRGTMEETEREKERLKTHFRNKHKSNHFKLIKFSKIVENVENYLSFWQGFFRWFSSHWRKHKCPYGLGSNDALLEQCKHN